MRQIVPDVYLVEGLRVANVYLLATEEGLTLVDSGASVGDADRIVARSKKRALGWSTSRRSC